MTTKLTITLTQDDDMGTDQGMARAVELLAALGVVPTRKVVLTLECKDDDAKRIRENVRNTLMQRTPGIVANIKTTQEEAVYCSKIPATTPMDKAGWN